jgi:hypothetical protein
MNADDIEQACGLRCDDPTVAACRRLHDERRSVPGLVFLYERILYRTYELGKIGRGKRLPRFAGIHDRVFVAGSPMFGFVGRSQDATGL